MGELGMTVFLLVAVAGFAWLIYRVVSTSATDGEGSARADANAVGALPGSEQVDDTASQERAHVTPGGNAV
jgi:hypothetical protein